jgi:hypothetical protein
LAAEHRVREAFKRFPAPTQAAEVGRPVVKRLAMIGVGVVGDINAAVIDRHDDSPLETPTDKKDS